MPMNNFKQIEIVYWEFWKQNFKSLIDAVNNLVGLNYYFGIKNEKSCQIYGALRKTA